MTPRNILTGLVALCMVCYAIPTVSGGLRYPERSRETRVAVVKARYEFANSMYKQLGKENPGRNLFFSPYSIYSAMSMTLLGARGVSETELESLLRFENCVGCSSRFHEENSIILKSINRKSNGVTLNTANRLFPALSYPLVPTFVTQSLRYYEAQTSQLDFGRNPDASRILINDWVSQRTNDKINDLLAPGSINSLTSLVLANAIYFKGTWVRKFDPRLTTRQNFYTNDNTVTKVDMMTTKGTFKYASNSIFSLVALPYLGGSVSMIFILPGKEYSLTRLEHLFNGDILQFLGDYGQKREITVSIPKFKMELQTDMKKTFQSLGVKSIFGMSADFSGISNAGGLVVSEIAHKAVIEVNEEGTVAAAATAVIMQRRLQRTPRIICDRPFFFLIKHNPTDTILFAGRYINPE